MSLFVVATASSICNGPVLSWGMQFGTRGSRESRDSKFSLIFEDLSTDVKLLIDKGHGEALEWKTEMQVKPFPDERENLLF